MNARHLALTALATLGLAGCFTADEPMISNDKAVAPYAKITFSEKGSPEDKTVMVREGTAYIADSDDTSVAMRFMPVGDDLYLTEVTGEQDGAIIRLYALTRLDTASNVATTYSAVGDDRDAGPGMTPCTREDMDMICVTDISAYVAHAKAAIEAGAPPDGTYDITLE